MIEAKRTVFTDRTHRAALGALTALLLLAMPGRALGWGAAMHAYINHRALELVRFQGRPWEGLDRLAYLAGAPAPDIWYATEEAKLVRPAGIEEDWEYVRLLFAECRNLRQLSWTLGYAGHIQGDVQGHRIYLAPNGNDANHLIRDSSSAFVLYGTYEGYPHYMHDVGLTVGQGLDTVKGTGNQPGQWRWGGFDQEKVDLMVRAAKRWCAAKPANTKGCPVSAATIKGLRDFVKNAVNSFATLTFVGYHAESSRAAANAKLVKSYDDKEFGANGGPAKLIGAMMKSIAETRDRLFYKEDVITWIRASAAPTGDVELLLAEEEGGCAVVGQVRGWPVLVLLVGVLVAARRRGE